jgi:hypothetical protein
MTETGDPASSHQMPHIRRIIHIDMDAFYASVEQRDDPSLRGLPVAVGGQKERGVVAAASYEARKFGVHSAMPSVTACRLCPALVFVPPRFDVYQSVSQQIQSIFACYTSIIQPLSLDEAYLDVTCPLINRGSATAIAEDIRAAIRAETRLTASAGVSYNKFLAKLASDLAYFQLWVVQVANRESQSGKIACGPVHRKTPSVDGATPSTDGILRCCTVYRRCGLTLPCVRNVGVGRPKT